MVFEFLKARIGQQNRPLNMALKALLRTCVWIPSSASAKRNICTRKWSTIGRTLDWGSKGCLFRTHCRQSHCVSVSLIHILNEKNC